MAADASVFWVLLWLLGTSVCFVLPLWPSLKELRYPSDASPLYIHSNHKGTVDFRAHELLDALPELESITQFAGLEASAQDGWRRLRQAEPSLEVRTQQSLIVEAPVITSLVSAADVRIEERVRIRKLLQARNVHCKAGSKMGLFTSASETLVLEPGVNFTKVSAARVLTLPPDVSSQTVVARDIAVSGITRLHTRRMQSLHLPAGARLQESLVIRGDLTTGDQVFIDGNIKLHGSVNLGRGAVITGSLFVQGHVVCHSGALVGGPLSVTGNIRLGAGCQVGAPSSSSSVMGHRVQLGQGVQVFGSISSVERGTVLKG